MAGKVTLKYVLLCVTFVTFCRLELFAIFYESLR